MTCVALAEIRLRGVAEPLEVAGLALREHIQRLGCMERWIADLNYTGAAYLDHNISGGFHIVTLGFEFKDVDAAFWFKMAWVG